jgi:tripartite-type tricarboxylate transporter receptor subunit TctC
VIYIAAPAGTPKEYVQRLNAAFNDAMTKPEIRTRLKSLGMTPDGGTPEALLEVIAAERVKWKRVIEVSGAKAQQ